MARQFFVGGNFKMNPVSREQKRALIKTLNDATLDPQTEVVIAPPALYLISVLDSLRKDVKVAAQNAHTKSSGAFTGEISPSQLVDAGIPYVILGHSERRSLFGETSALVAQNAHTKSSGAFTGEISPSQLVDAGIPYVILGHSERRSLFGETSALVAQKTRAAIDAGLKVILCVGETLEERESGKTQAVVEAQLQAVVDAIKPEQWSAIVVAYEPVWAIGTGKVATSAQAQEVHAATRKYLSSAVSPAVGESTRIIYGGSVTAANCKDIGSQPDVDGFLVGGASLKPEFVDICNAQKA